MKLIVNADDFGITRATNFGILDCLQNGILTTTTMMTNAPATMHAIELTKKYDLPVGIHLVASMFHPLTDCSSWVKEDGTFDKQKFFTQGDLVDTNQLRKEWFAQMEFFIEHVGKKPTHIDSHHHAHLQPVASEIIKEIADYYQLPVRNIKTNYGEDVYFYHEFYSPNVSVDVIADAIKHSDIVELMVHPAYVDQKLIEVTSYNMGRLPEIDVLMSDEAKALIISKGVELINYLDVQK